MSAETTMSIYSHILKTLNCDSTTAALLTVAEMIAVTEFVVVPVSEEEAPDTPPTQEPQAESTPIVQSWDTKSQHQLVQEERVRIN